MRTENPSGQTSIKTTNKRNVKTKDNKQNLLMFVSVFFVLLLVFLGFAKIMSPDVDISIGDDSVTTERDANNDDYSNSGTVDARLKALQQEDEDSQANIEEDGLVKIPETKSKSEKSEQEIEDAIVLEEEPIKKQPAQEPQKTITPATPTVSRVVVGFYNTQAQAEVAKGILQDAGLGVTPHVRPLNGGYTLQVGAYSSKEAANNLANRLLMNNYPARVIEEAN